MSSITLTPEQNLAIRTVGQSLLVSAAAGSGKTSVLAERCVYLLCDAPEPFRCNLDELLVLTFTEAAAAQMRERILGALRRRLEEGAEDTRLRDQLALADLARISTVHAFCNDLIRRHFVETGIDPRASILSEEESAILATEVRDALFERLYRVAQEAGHPEHRAGQAFVSLVGEYGLGDDRRIALFVLRLAAFLDSLPAPDRWLADARRRLEPASSQSLAEAVGLLEREIADTAAGARLALDGVRRGDERAGQLRSRLQTFMSELEAWGQVLHQAGVLFRGANDAEAAALYDRVRREIETYALEKPVGLRRNHRNPSPDDVALNEALDAFDDVVALFRRRVQTGLVPFTSIELLETLTRVAPHAHALLSIVEKFRAEYAARKRREDVLDFADLERLAYRVLVCAPSPSSDEKQAEGSCPPSGCEVADRLLTPVARAVRERFAHVLVDEFQDINPLQAAIISAVSRDEGRGGNLFVVGDVKQSIYRFRLAEPGIFLERERRLRSRGQDGFSGVITLRDNFRSAAPVIEWVNIVFESLWTPGAGLIDYDESARLRHARTEASDAPAPPVEVHLLSRDTDEDDEPAAEGGVEAPTGGGVDDPAHWLPMEREAYLIGDRIRRLIAEGAGTRDGEPLRYRDCAVLVRAARDNARRIERMLNRLEIPTYADTGGDFFAAREIREVVAALRVLDNPKQDVPIASVLRTGFFGPAFSVDDLAELRLGDPSAPFHVAVERYAEKGPAGALRDRLRAVLDTIDYFRRAVQRRPLAEVLWELYERSGQLARVSAESNGSARRANLLRLHDHARRFASFHRQGLYRFLRFVELLEEETQRPATASPQGGGADAVRIMTIHASKGLEFPVVFVAGLGTRLNRQDLAGAFLYGRVRGLGMQVVDPEKCIMYPSLAYVLVRDEIESHLAEEESRVLYVAMTRARERLILTASPRKMPTPPDDRKVLSRRYGCAAPLRSAEAPMDWILPVLYQHTPQRVAWFKGESPGSAWADMAPRAGVQVHLWSPCEMSGWSVERAWMDRSAQQVREAVAALKALPVHEPLVDDEEVRAVMERADWVYPHLSVSSLPAVVAASEVQRGLDALRDPEERLAGREFRPFSEEGGGGELARRRGIATHRFLQHLDFSRGIGGDVTAQIQACLRGRVLSDEDAATLDAAGIGWFLGTPLAARMGAATLHRELPYIELAPAILLDPAAEDFGDDDRILIRGIVDAVLEDEKGVEIVDYKTDVVAEAALDARASYYGRQVEHYARAAEGLFGKPVTACHLVFLSARRIITFESGKDWTCTGAVDTLTPRSSRRSGA